jgi:hypothetical protein
MARKRKLTDEEEQDVRELTEVMLAFRDEHNRAPTMDELKAWWKAHCEARLRKVSKLCKGAGTPVVLENGKYRLLPFGTDLSRN